MIVKPSVSFLTAFSDPLLVNQVGIVFISMTGNVNYTPPPAVLALVKTANDDFAAAIAAAADGGKQLKSAKNAKRKELVALMRQLANYVQGACGGDMTKLLSSGFPVQKPDRSPSRVPKRPDTPRVKQGLSGQLMASTDPDPFAYIFNWQATLASKPDEVVARSQSTSARTTLSGLIPGQVYNIRSNAVGTAGTSDWSNPGTLMVI